MFPRVPGNGLAAELGGGGALGPGRVRRGDDRRHGAGDEEAAVAPPESLVANSRAAVLSAEEAFAPSSMPNSDRVVRRTTTCLATGRGLTALTGAGRGTSGSRATGDGVAEAARAATAGFAVGRSPCVTARSTAPRHRPPRRPRRDGRDLAGQRRLDGLELARSSDDALVQMAEERLVDRAAAGRRDRPRRHGGTGSRAASARQRSRAAAHVARQAGQLRRCGRDLGELGGARLAVDDRRQQRLPTPALLARLDPGVALEEAAPALGDAAVDLRVASSAQNSAISCRSGPAP